MKKFVIGLFCFLCSVATASGHGDGRETEITELKRQMEVMQQQFQQMQARIDELEAERDAAGGTAQHQDMEVLSARVGQLEQRQSARGGPLAGFNPAISVIGDFTYYATDEDDAEGDNNFRMREVEIAFSASVDPYARADFFVSIEQEEDGDVEIELEEGYLTLLETPIKDLQGKFGKFRPFFGKTNRMHTHQLPWVDYPMVVRDFFGEHGFSETGASLSYLLPVPRDIFSEITAEVFNNNDAKVFGGGDESETVYLGHWKNFFELTPDTSLELGGSVMFGENEEGRGSRSKVTGVDLTLNTHLFDNLRTTSHTEAFFSKWQRPEDDDIDAWGMFTSLEQQLSKRWWTFFRYDYSQMPTDPDERAHAYSTGLTFAQSEYAFWRLQFTHADHKMAESTNEVWLQLNFGIGPHRAHEYR